MCGTRSIIPGRPVRLSFGKYVPAKKGFFSGVSITVIGQPPPPVSAWVNVM